MSPKYIARPAAIILALLLYGCALDNNQGTLNENLLAASSRKVASGNGGYTEIHLSPRAPAKVVLPVTIDISKLAMRPPLHIAQLDKNSFLISSTEDISDAQFGFVVPAEGGASYGFRISQASCTCSRDGTVEILR